MSVSPVKNRMLNAFLLFLIDKNEKPLPANEKRRSTGAEDGKIVLYLMKMLLIRGN